jgi:hypothetical protein
MSYFSFFFSKTMGGHVFCVVCVAWCVMYILEKKMFGCVTLHVTKKKHENTVLVIIAKQK